MNSIAIMKRELKSYFTSLIAYVVIAIFLLLSGGFFYSNLVAMVTFVGSDVKIGLWQQTFWDMRYITIMLLPLLTMRLFSEEKKLGTIELLYTSPIRDLDIILGKYLACLTVLCIMLVLTFLYPVLLEVVFSVALGPLITGYAGLLLLGAACIACGIFVSSLTENQIVSAILTLGVLLFLWLIDWNESLFGERAVVVLHQVSLSDHFFNFIKGVVDVDDVVYYLSMTFLFLFLTHCSVESRKWRGK